MTRPKRFSQLTMDEQTEILSDPAFAQYAEQLKREDWFFSKSEKGKLAGKWATY